MSQFLIFRLHGAFSAFGAVTVGKFRNVSHFPTRSGILGFVCSALGVSRDDENLQLKVHQGYGMALRVDREDLSREAGFGQICINIARPVRIFRRADDGNVRASPEAREHFTFLERLDGVVGVAAVARVSSRATIRTRSTGLRRIVVLGSLMGTSLLQLHREPGLKVKSSD